MDVLKAIYQRRAVRHFSDARVTSSLVMDLIRAAAQAPSALNLQPWVFSVFHGRERLLGYSERAKAYLLTTSDPSYELDSRIDRYANPAIDIFHGADTLIVISAKPGRFSPAEDCFLAAQNLMLAAHGLGLGSCPIGFARPWFNLPEVKAELGIPSHYVPVMPIVVGNVEKSPAIVPRCDPEITVWSWDE